MSGEPVQLLVANLGCLGFHSWPIRAHQPNVTDELRINLDPGPGTNSAMAQQTTHVATVVADGGQRRRSRSR